MNGSQNYEQQTQHQEHHPKFSRKGPTEPAGANHPNPTAPAGVYCPGEEISCKHQWKFKFQII